MKTLSIKFVIALLGILPAYSFSAYAGGGMDMEAYSMFLSYGFFVMIAAFFGYFLYCVTHPQIYIPKQITMPVNILQDRAGFEKIIPALNRVYFTIIILLALYTAIFVVLLV